jgi:hypothetical protein
MKLKSRISNLQQLLLKKSRITLLKRKVTCFSTDEIFFALIGLHEEYQCFKKEFPSYAKILKKNKHSLHYLKKLLKKVSSSKNATIFVENIISHTSQLLNSENKLRWLLLRKYITKLPKQQTHQIFNLNYKSFLEHS